MTPPADAVGYGTRQILLGLVALAMATAFVVVGGRPRVTFAFFAALAVVLMLNLERLRRRRP